MTDLLIADDNMELVKNIINNVIGKKSNIRLVKIATNGEEAMDCIMHNNLDVIILDMKIPKISGKEILEKIDNMDKKPNVIIITGYDTELYKIEKKDYIYSYHLKPVIMERLRKDLEELNFYCEEKNIRDFIKKELSVYEFNKASRGYKYLEDSIFIAIKNPDLLMNMEKNLFLAVSKMYKDTKLLNVKWSIEKLIKSSYKYTNEDKSTKSFINDVLEKYNSSKGA